MNEIKKIPPLPLLSTLEVNPERDEWIKQREIELEEQSEKEAAYHTQKRVESSGVPRRYWHVNFDTYITRGSKDSKNLETIKKFTSLENNDKVLILLGAKGLGKTHLGAAIIRNCGGKFISIEELIFKYESAQDFHSKTNREELMDSYSSTTMLVIDEIGRSMQQEKENSLLNYILRRRYENMLPTVLISNLPKSDLLKKLGEAVLDRLKETCISVEFEGESYRPSKRDVNL
ncbi:MAG: ATP-binding protein [Treponemataceae bacterium]|nr:ATP-binding protein [Treponemataceae bacterium]